MTEQRGGSLSSLRQYNRSAIVSALSDAGALSRADVARATGMSRTTVSSVVHQMLRDGVVTEEAERGQPHKGGSGRPPTLLRLVTAPGPVVGVDLDHRHIRVAVAGRNSEIHAERTVPLDVDGDAARALDVAACLVRETLTAAGAGTGTALGIGMGVPGPIHTSSGRVTSAILRGWRGIAPGAELEHRVGLPVALDNDAYAGVLGERRYGAATGLDDVIYVKVAAGVGAGIVLAGRAHRGASGIAGELGHVQVREDGPVCRCGSRGCLETQVSAAKLIELVQPAHSEPLTISGMLDLERDGDAGVTRVLADAGRSTGRVLADLCNSLNPAAVVVGGALGISAGLVAGIQESVDRYAQPDTAAALRVTAGGLGARAEVMGAVALALDAHAIRHGLVGGLR